MALGHYAKRNWLAVTPLPKFAFTIFNLQSLNSIVARYYAERK